MKYQVLGKTGLSVSEVGFGGIPIIRLTTQEAVRVLKYAFDKGITLYDNANAYKDSEEKMGRAFQGIRNQVVLTTKTLRRNAEGAAEHINNSLRMFQTDYIDLFQFHQVAQEKDWEAILARGGAMEAATKAKEQGKIRHIGVTSHSLPMAIKMIKTGLFETVQFPFNIIETAAKDELYPLAEAMNIGVLAMKPFAGGAIDSAALAFKYLRQYPIALPIPGFDSENSVDEIIGLYEKPNQVSEKDLEKMQQYRDDLGKQFCRRCEYCQPCPNGVMITPAMGYPIIAKRMSPAISVDFSGQAMKSVENCIDCGICVTRCPYELPIPEILKKNYDLFEQHRNSK